MFYPSHKVLRIPARIVTYPLKLSNHSVPNYPRLKNPWKMNKVHVFYCPQSAWCNCAAKSRKNRKAYLFGKQDLADIHESAYRNKFADIWPVFAKSLILRKVVRKKILDCDFYEVTLFDVSPWCWTGQQSSHGFHGRIRYILGCNSKAFQATCESVENRFTSMGLADVKVGKTSDIQQPFVSA